jgi:SAM-dependent methyltransferase
MPRDAMTPDRPTMQARAQYGLRVMERAVGVLGARVRPAPARSSSAVAFNTMFGDARVAELQPERHLLEQFDLYLYDVMTSPRLKGQIVFEYGTLLRAVPSWRGLRVLDVGTGRSTFPRWMSSRGAIVTTFDLATPAEHVGGGFQDRVDRVVARRPGVLRPVAGSMLSLPFADGSFDLVTSLSVVEHLDTDFPGRDYVPPAEQQRRLACVLDEMVRVTAPAGRVYVTSECCDYARATTDNWRGAYYYREGPPLSAAWPVRDVPRLFYDRLAAHGCRLEGGVDFRPDDIAVPAHWTFRGPHFSGFSVLARKL